MNFREDWQDYKNLWAKHLPARFAKFVKNSRFDKFVFIYLAGVFIIAAALFFIA